METLHGVPTYIASPASPSRSTSAIIYFTDAFGLTLINNKILADTYASATGLRVLVPDIIPGGAVPHTVMDSMELLSEPVSLFNLSGQISRILAALSVAFHFIPFMLRARPNTAKVHNLCLAYARSVKAELPPGSRLGIAGFCWGGYLSVNLCTQTAVEGGSERLVDAAFAAHPSFLKAPDDIVNAVLSRKTPLAVAHAEHDSLLKTAQVEEAEAKLMQKVGAGDGENGYDYQIKVYKGVKHGFAVRAGERDEVAARAADDAKEQAVQWFKKWL